MNAEDCFDLRPDVKYPHLGATTLPNFAAKLHLGAIRNELSAQCGQERRNVYVKQLQTVSNIFAVLNHFCCCMGVSIYNPLLCAGGLKA